MISADNGPENSGSRTQWLKRLVEFGALHQVNVQLAFYLPYLFKMRHTAKVKELVTRMMRQGAHWQDCGDGWQALETTLRLSGWTRERRVILVHESPARAPIREVGKDRQKLLPNAKGAGWDSQATPWSGKIAVIVTSLDPVAFPTIVMPKHHREAIRSRPMLMAGVGRQVQSGGQRTVKVSVLHEKGGLIAQAVTQISKELHQIRAITER